MPSRRSKKSQPRHKSSWLPKNMPDQAQLRPGEPYYIPLVRYADSQYVFGEYRSKCCGCGFEHIETLEVHRLPSGQYVAIGKAFGLDETRPKSVKRRA